MALTTQQVMNENSSLWGGIAAMVTAAGTLGTKIAEIQGVRNVQEQDVRGVALDKVGKKVNAIDAGLLVIGGLKAFAKATRNNTLLKKIDYTRSELEKARDTIITDKLKVVRDEATNNIRLLTPYNVTAAGVNSLSSAIAAYEVMVPKPRVALNIRKNATEALDRLFREMDEPLKIMDGLMDTLRQTQPGFVETFSNARIIVGSSNGGGGVSGVVSDKSTGAPLVGVLVSINAPQHKSRVNALSATRSMTAATNADGHYEMRRLPAGLFTVTMQKDGYAALTVPVVIEEGSIAKGDGKMVRVIAPGV